MWRVLSSALLFLLLPVWPLAAQDNKDEEKTTIELKQQTVDSGDKVVGPMIGLDAFKEVMESGEYRVGPGDEFLIFVTGMEEPYMARVLAEGGLFIPKVGSVSVGGLKLGEVRRRVEERFRQSMKVGQISFELSVPRHFPVPVVGLVREPGIKTASGVERVSQVLAKAGERLASSSRRNIRLIRTARLDAEQRARIGSQAAAGHISSQILEEIGSERVDLDMYQITGESRYNPFIEDGDIIMVPPPTAQMGALGAVQRPRFFELVPGDRISDLMKLAMGTAPSYDPDNIQLFRFQEDMVTRISIEVDLQKALAGDPDADLVMRPDDWLNVHAIPSYHQRSELRIVGEVVYPGYYVVNQEGIPLREAIAMAGGLTESASLAEARVVRQKFLEEEADVDPEFERIRFISVADRTEEENQYFIMKSRERQGQMAVDFVDLFDRGDEAQNIRLIPGDVVFVPTLQRTVMVSGAVSQPGAVIYKPDLSVDGYIERAGGLSWRASKEVLVIKARTGERKRARDVLVIQPGDRIWVKEKPERDYWVLFTQTMGVVGQVSTVVLLYATLTK